MAEAPVTGDRDSTAQYLVERAVRMALEHAALITAVRAAVAGHPPICSCVLDVALAVDERRQPGTPRRDS